MDGRKEIFPSQKNHQKKNHGSNWPGAFSLRGRKRWLRTDKKERERDKCGCLPQRERERERERERGRLAWLEVSLVGETWAIFQILFTILLRIFTLDLFSINDLLAIFHICEISKHYWMGLTN